MSYLKRCRSFVVFFAFIVIGFGIFLLIKQFKVSVLCVPNEENLSIQIVAENAEINGISLKYNNGLLRLDEGAQTLTINGEGTEYIRVYYIDCNNRQHYLDFEIVVSEGNAISISKLNALGQQIEYHTY